MILMTLAKQWQREQVRHQLAIAGILSDQLTQQPIPAAEIRMIQAPQSFRERLKIKALQFDDQGQPQPGFGERCWISPDGSFALVNLADGSYTVQTWTAVDGSFKFLDLPDGDYVLQASLPAAGTRYGTATSASLTVTRNQDKITPALVELQLPPTAITGNVTAPAPVEGPIGRSGNSSANGDPNVRSTPAPKTIPVPMAKVQILETGDSTYTNDAGEYLLSRLEASKTKDWAIAVAAPGYELDAPDSLIKVKLLQGQTQTQDFHLKRKGSPSTGKPQ